MTKTRTTKRALRIAVAIAISSAPLTLVPACGSSSNGPEAGLACGAVGGTCLLGARPCAQHAPSTAQDCNPTENPGGAFCCLQIGDGGLGD